MIIIYNVSGLLLAGAGIVAGLFAALLSGWLSLGLLTLAVIWFAGGLWWRNQEISRGVKRPFPALFFIPLPFLAVPVAFLAMLLFVAIELGARAQPADRRAELFRADERMLESAVAAGDAQLSQKILTLVQAIPVEGKNTEPCRVTTRKNADAVLVLVKAPALKHYTDDVRRALLRHIADVVRDDEQLKEKQIYIGIKGRLTYGAIQTPPDDVEIASVVPESKLYDFYRDPAAPARVALAGSPPGGKENLPMDIPAEHSPRSDTAGDDDIGAAGPPVQESNGAEGEGPDEEQRGRDAPAAAQSPEDNASPGAKTGDAQAEKSPDDKAAARAKKREDAQAERARQASKREMERAELKKRDDEQMAERKKRSDERSAERKKQSDERLAELKKRSDEQLASSMLEAAESQRQFGTPRDYRKRLKEIVDKYPETEAGKKAKKLLK